MNGGGGGPEIRLRYFWRFRCRRDEWCDAFSWTVDKNLSNFTMNFTWKSVSFDGVSGHSGRDGLIKSSLMMMIPGRCFSHPPQRVHKRTPPGEIQDAGSPKPRNNPPAAWKKLVIPEIVCDLTACSSAPVPPSAFRCDVSASSCWWVGHYYIIKWRNWGTTRW